MFQRAIDLQAFADIFDELEVHGRIREGAVWVTTGNHPRLGAVVALQDWQPQIILHSENAPELCGIPATCH